MKAMRGRVIAGMVVVAFTVFAVLAVLSGRTVAQSPFGDANAEPAPFNPQMAALMSMLIQPRHAKLGLAGKAENWPLAGYMLKELRQGFVVASRAIPRWKGLPVGELFDAAARFRDQDQRAAPVQRGLRQAHGGLQCLPRHHRPLLRGDQGAGLGGG